MKCHMKCQPDCLKKKIKMSSAAILEEVGNRIAELKCIVAVQAVMAMGSPFFSIRRWHFFHSNMKFGRSCDRRKPVNKWFGVKEARHRRMPFCSKTNAAHITLHTLHSGLTSALAEDSGIVTYLREYVQYCDVHVLKQSFEYLRYFHIQKYSPQ